MSREQVLIVKEYLDKMLNKGYIRKSTSSYTVLVLIVKKLDRGLRIYINYRALNALTIRNRNTPPLIKETLLKLYTTKIYSKFNIITAFNKIRIKKGYKEKTAFLTKYRLFKYIVILFELYNTLSIF